ncbi:MAG: YifB family Mg chelatase-like AAA ATPase [Terriglobia bacterium]
MPTILPPLEKVEAIEVSKIYSVAGLLPTESPIIFDRPFRSPHHTISAAGLVGGGRVPRPGEISLSHNGVLFLDEFPEFQKHILEVLRQPMESGDVTISRAHSSLTYPARFTLVAAMNPCPCGFHADAAMECVCSPGQIRKYRTRVSGPLLDRLDIHVEVPRLKKEELLETRIGERSETIKERVQAARARQLARFPGVRNATNAGMGAGQARQVCALSGAAMTFLDSALDRLGLSGRVFERVLKVSLTIADLAGADAIEVDHIAEALQYRSFTWGVTV